jgi:hypothetical protein
MSHPDFCTQAKNEFLIASQTVEIREAPEYTVSEKNPCPLMLKKSANHSQGPLNTTCFSDFDESRTNPTQFS